ncbi:MAG: hypothetical protein IJ302_04000 [Clostridia bacterium]|nr:hypothetical protein [Clostridia bacterium]
MKFTEKLMRFMYGRNGMDALNNALFYTYLVLFVVNLFAGSAILSGLCTFAAVWMMFRCFSRNLPARRNENMKYWSLKTKLEAKASQVGILRRLGAWWKKITVRAKNIGTKRYRTCPHCRAQLCLPRRTGSHTVRCPRCAKEFGVRIVI